MGVVFLVKHNSINSHKPYALKTFQRAPDSPGESEKLFQKEALIWIQLGCHPNIVQAFSVEVADTVPCVVMEYMPHGSLQQLLYRKRTLPLRQVLHFAINICDGLRHARDKLGIIHRDIKPANCMLAENKSVKITDFGVSIARRNAYKEHELHVPADGGTPGYRAPEQQRGNGDIDERADIHAIGITLAELLTGKLLARTAIISGVAKGHFSDGLWPLIYACVQDNREDRPKTLDVLRGMLEVCCFNLFGEVAPGLPQELEYDSDTDQDIAASFVALGQYSLAVNAYEKALETKPADSALWAGLSAAHYGAGALHKAVEVADKGLALGSDTTSLLNNKGQALSALNLHNDAIACFGLACRIDPANPLILWNYAKVLLAVERREEAIQACDVAIASNPRFVRAFALKADLLLSVGKVDSAMKLLTDAMRIDPYNSEVLFGFSCVLDLQGKLSDSLEYAGLCLRIEPDNLSMLRHKAWVLLKLGRGQDAIGVFDRLLHNMSVDIEALRGKALAQLVIGDKAGCSETIQYAQTIDPDNVKLGEVLQLLGK